jgi:O-antigen/teichoic acid export membrane protein
MSLNKILRSSFWLYASGIASSFLGYLYWLLASGFVPPSAIGDAVFIVGIASLAASLFAFGLSSGATLMFGRSFGHGDRSALSAFFASSLVLSLSIYAAVALLVLLLAPLVGFARLDTLFMSSLIVLGGWPQILRALYQSTLRTGVIALATILSSVLRLALGFALLYTGWGFVGVMLAYVIASLSADLVLILMLGRSVSLARPSITPAREVLRAGIADYVPSLVASAGTWLGIVGIYGFVGSSETGTYYIAFSIALIVYSIPASLLGLMFPVLSGMDDGRKRAASRAVRLSLAVTAPLAALGIAYPYVPLSLLGPSYLAGSFPLQILLVGCLVAPVTSGFNSLVYAYGKFRYVTLLGLAQNVPRVALYPFLVAAWGENGAAVAFVSGYAFAMAAVAVLARRVGYSVGWGHSLVLAAIPLGVTAAVWVSGLHWALSTIILAAVTVVAYARLGLVTRTDLAEISRAFLSTKRLGQVYPYAKYVLKVLYGE